MALFTGPAHALYTQALAALEPGTRLPVLLDISDPSAASLPWESLLDTERGEFLALDAGVGLARCVPAPAGAALPAPGAGPLRGLVIAPGAPPPTLAALLGAGDP